MDMFTKDMPLIDVPPILECMRVDIDHIFQDICYRCRSNDTKTNTEFLRLLRQELVAQRIRNDLTQCDNPLLQELEHFFEKMLQPFIHNTEVVTNEDEEEDVKNRQNEISLIVDGDELVYLHDL